MVVLFIIMVLYYYHYVGDIEEVSLFQFMESVAIKIPSKWKVVGLALGLSQSQIDDIEKERSADPLGCFSDVFRHRQQLSPPQQPMSWTTLTTVLCSESVGETGLADSLRESFIGKTLCKEILYHAV